MAHFRALKLTTNQHFFRVSLSTLGSQIPCVISVIMAVERYISVKYPFWYHVHVKYSTRLKMIFGAFFLCFVSLIGQFIGAYFDTEIKFPRGMCATSLAAPYWYYVLHYTVILTGHTIAFIVTCTVYFLAHRATNVLASQANLSLRSQLNAARQRTRRSHTTTNQSSGGNVLHLEQDRQHHREAWQSSQQQSHNSTNESPLNGPRRKFGVVHQNPTDNIKASSSGLARRHLKTEPHGVTAQVNRSEHLLGQPNGEDLRVHGETSEQHQELRTRLESIHAQLPEFQSQRARTTSVHHITPYETQISASVHQQQQENLQNQKDVQYIKTLLAVSLLSVLLIVIPNGLVLMVRSQTFLADLSVSIIGGRQRIPKIFTLYCANSIVNLFVYLVFLRPFRARFFKLVFHVNIPSTHGFGQVQPILSIPVHNSRNLSNFDRHTIEI